MIDEHEERCQEAREKQALRDHIAQLERECEALEERARIDQQIIEALRVNFLGARSALEQLQGAASMAVTTHVQKALTDTAQAGREAEARAVERALAELKQHTVLTGSVASNAVERQFNRLQEYIDRLRTDGEA
jgi:rRNA-processing protein FCF1